MQLALKVSTSVDLGEYSRLLWQHKISHQITQYEGQHFVLVESGNEERAKQLFAQWQDGQLKPREEDSSELSSYFKGDAVETAFFRALVHAPLTVSLIIACSVLLYLAPLAEPTTWTYALMFPDFSYGTRILNVPRILADFTPVTFFRMITPILLHGGLVHLVFNMLWLWELGKRIEHSQRTLSFACTLAVVAVFSNTIQYLYGTEFISMARNFGGMSGVVYGLFAYIWMWQLFDPKKGMNLPTSLIVFMLLSLAVMTYLGLEIIADEAHLGGFFTGLLYGAVTATFSRIARAAKKTDSPQS